MEPIPGLWKLEVMDTFVFLFFLAATSFLAGALFQTSLATPTSLSEQPVQVHEPQQASWRLGSEGLMTVLALSICAAILSF